MMNYLVSYHQPAYWQNTGSTLMGRGTILNGAVVAGVDSDGNKIFVGRAYYRGLVLFPHEISALE